MAFVNEFVPEEDKVKLDPKVFYNSVTGNEIDSRWTIDRERDIFMIHLGGGSRGLFDLYALSIGGEVVKFRGHGLSTPTNGDKVNGYDLERWVFDFKIPPNLQGREAEIMRIIEEANLAQGNGGPYNRDWIKSVTTHFNRPEIKHDNW